MLIYIRKQVISKYTAADAAPPWFTVAIDDLKESMQSMEKRLSARLYNGAVRFIYRAAFSLTLPPEAANNVESKREIIAEYLGIRLQSVE